MSEKNVEKPRKCETCQETLTTTASGIKKHEEECRKLKKAAK